MTNQETSVINKIKEMRPHLSAQSVKTYTSIITNLFKKIFPDKTFDIGMFDDDSKVIKHLQAVEPNKRKTILAALVIITNKPSYRRLMLEDISKYNEEQHQQTKNEKQDSSWVDTNQVVDLYKKLEKEANAIYKKHADGSTISVDELQNIQKYIIMSLLSGVYIPPRRSKDYVEFKLKNIDKDKDNYMEKNKFVFNNYKTAKTYGKQVIDVPKKLVNIINKWAKVNPTDYLLFDSNKNKLSNVKLNQRLNKLFDKKVSVNQLRHTYLSDKYQHSIETNKAMSEDMKKMGSSTIQEKIYIKKDKPIKHIEV